MDYIPRKKVLIEKYSTKKEMEEFVDEVFSSLYIISFSYDVEGYSHINGNIIKTPTELTYFVSKGTNIISFLLSKEIKNNRCSFFVDNGFILGMRQFVDIKLFLAIMTNYIRKKTNIKLGTYSTTLQTKYQIILTNHLSTINPGSEVGHTSFPEHLL